jgi:hypothetical protein
LQAIEFFYQIESRALHNSRHPSPRASRMAGSLCLAH